MGSPYKTERIGGKGFPDRESLIAATSRMDIDFTVAPSIFAPMSTSETLIV